MRNKWRRVICTSMVLLFCIIYGTANIVLADEFNNDQKNGSSNQREITQEKDGIDNSIEQGNGNAEQQGQATGQQQKADKGGMQETDPLQIYLTLGALFGVGSVVAVIIATLSKFIERKKVIPLPVLYYEYRGEEI